MILLTVNKEVFALDPHKELSIDDKNYIEAICRSAYDEESDFEEAFVGSSYDDGERTIYDLTPYEAAELLVSVIKDKVGIEADFMPIDLEVYAGWDDINSVY